MRGKRTNFGNGIDFNSDITDQIGFNVDTDKSAVLLTMTLLSQQSQLHRARHGLPDRHRASSLPRRQARRRYMAQSQHRGPFDDAVTVINDKALAYAEEQADRMGKSATVDFSARAKPGRQRQNGPKAG